ncbi:MAG: hypothetical protein K0S27_651 [Gammaproteobacteria bacterium]|jgi:ubiquinone biosynthesis protein UbiJ|nr:hypothetical protein [Gammaproteobacteria bacterium]
MLTTTDQFIENYLPKILNRYLALDPESSHRLQALQDKVVTIELLIHKSPSYKKGKNIFQIIFSPTGITFKRQDFFESDVYIKGTPLSLLRMLLTKENRKNFFSEDVGIEGSLELGQQIIDLFDALEIDWEEYLSHWISDIPAHHLFKFVRKTALKGSRLQTTFIQNINEYIHEEASLFPPLEALQDFYNDVDNLRMDTDRLEKNMQQLTKKIEAKRNHS